MANMRLVKLKNRPSKGVFVFEYMQEQIERLRGQGKERVSGFSWLVSFLLSV